MSYINELLSARELPPLILEGDAESRRREYVRILSENIYGFTPDFKSEVRVIEKTYNRLSYGGKSRTECVTLGVTTPSGEFSFPLWYTYPVSDKKVPLIVNIRFDIHTPSGTAPDEEIVDRGVAIAKVYYQDIAADRYDDFKEGVAPMFPREDGCRTLWGKIGMWAWAASRALDYLLTLDKFDTARIAVAGHSRLGKPALWCGAQDTRFTHVISSNAGCSGDALTRGKEGETLEDITRVFGYWFCDKYRDYKDDGIKNMPFDQHYLIAACAPRKVAVGASSKDLWACPTSEYLCLAAASEAWESLGLTGFIAPDRLPEIGENFDDGHLAYHLREGEHAMVRVDWMTYVDFLLK